MDQRIRQVYETHREPLMSYLLRLTLGNRPAAEDILQETMLRAWQHRRQLPVDVKDARPWLFTVARRVAIDASRARRVRPAEVALTDRVREPELPDIADSVTDVHTVRAALPRINPDHRAVLVALYLHQRTIRETASLLDIPDGTVKSRAHYALRSLAAAVGAAGAHR